MSVYSEVTPAVLPPVLRMVLQEIFVDFQSKSLVTISLCPMPVSFSELLNLVLLNIRYSMALCAPYWAEQWNVPTALFIFKRVILSPVSLQHCHSRKCVAVLFYFTDGFTFPAVQILNSMTVLLAKGGETSGYLKCLSANVGLAALWKKIKDFF